jgi:hypothetical protein
MACCAAANLNLNFKVEGQPESAVRLGVCTPGPVRLRVGESEHGPGSRCQCDTQLPSLKGRISMNQSNTDTY